MNFILAESYDLHDWNGEKARTFKGVSGAFNAMIYIAEGLVCQGNNVIIVSMKNHVKPTKYNGVVYMNIQDVSTI